MTAGEFLRGKKEKENILRVAKNCKTKDHYNLKNFESSVFGTPEISASSSPTVGERQLSRPMSVPDVNLRSVPVKHG